MKILLVEDNQTLGTLIKMMLEEESFEVVHSLRGDEAKNILEKTTFDIVITDIKLPGLDGYEIIKFVSENAPDTVVIAITAYSNIKDAVYSIKLGAYDYIPKPFDNDVFISTVKKAANFKELKTENTTLKNYLKSEITPEIVGKSKKIIEVLKLAEKVAQTDAPVLLLGESGTGKELIARKIHCKSKRISHPFISVNCAAIPESLFESEFFGHKKGAFTGADRDKKGKISQAHKGTLFLDEIGELPENMQAKLLRFLQEKEIQPLGGLQSERVDVRIIAATNRDLKELVRKNLFREDLYYRLNVFPIYIPPLRERKEDIKELSEFFLKKYGYKNLKITDDVIDALSKYTFPGNIRELENIIYRMAILSKDGKLDTSTIFLDEITDLSTCLNFKMPEDSFDILQFEKEIILKALKKFNGNKTKAAKYLCIPRHVLLYRLEKFDQIIDTD